MSLARNPNMPYAVAGQQSQPFERMSVRSNVHVPFGEMYADDDDRRSYSAPNSVCKRKGGMVVSMPFALTVVAAAVIVVAVLYIAALVNRASVYSKQQNIVSEMRTMQQEITVLQAEVAQARDSSNICYQAAQRLGMVSSEGVEQIEIYAPDTRPNIENSAYVLGSAAWQ